MKEQIIRMFSPNKSLKKQSLLIMVILQILILLYFWLTSGPLMPKPIEIFKAFILLVKTEGLIYELGVSTGLILKSLTISVFISLFIAYSNVLPWFRPLGFIWSKLKFLTILGLSYVFTIYSFDLKVSLMVFGMSAFMVPGAIFIVNSVTRNSLNHARTLGMNEWEVVYRKQIVGTVDQIFELSKHILAIGWVMLTMVEGLVRSGGGIGVMLLNNNKHFVLDSVFAIQICIIFVGITCDYSIDIIRKLICPYANLTLERK